MKFPFKTPGSNEFENQFRSAFKRALLANPERTKLSGRVFHALCSTAGIRKV